MTESTPRIDAFQPIAIPEIPEADYGVFNALNDILRRVGKAGQRSAQAVELLQGDIKETVEHLRSEMDQNRLRQNQIDLDMKTLETGLLDFMDIIDNLHMATASIDDPAFTNAVEVAVRAKDQINERIGVQKIPGEGSRFDNEVHFVADVQLVDSQHQDGIVLSVIENGYRRGSRLLRRSTVVCGKWQGA